MATKMIIVKTTLLSSKTFVMKRAHSMKEVKLDEWLSLDEPVSDVALGQVKHRMHSVL